MSCNIIYGAGVYGEIFHNEIEKNGIEINYFIDQYTDKESLCGKPIRRLENLDLSESNIFVALSFPRVELKVIKILKEMSANNIFSLKDTLYKFPDITKLCTKATQTWCSGNTHEMINIDGLLQFKKLLKDKKSISLLDTIINFRKELSPQTYPDPDLDAQYFPQDIDLFSHLDKIRFVDGGAFIGDTLAESIDEFKKIGKKVDYIASFEPDRSNIGKLSIEVLKHKAINPEINFLIYPCGLWSGNEFLQFNNNSNSTSSIVNKPSANTTTIMTTCLDQTLIGSSVNYIKMDLEGAEKEALIGAKKIIGEQSPVLAISLYHKPEDLWELPLLINSINPNYDMHLRIYGSMGLELNLYCVPKNV